MCGGGGVVAGWQWEVCFPFGWFSAYTEERERNKSELGLKLKYTNNKDISFCHALSFSHLMSFQKYSAQILKLESVKYSSSSITRAPQYLFEF
jgi:hypothetical protein